MVATPMRLVDALRFNGYTIERVGIGPLAIPIQTAAATGTINVPAILTSSLNWQRGGMGINAAPSDSFYLESLPIFDEAYRPVILGAILDRFMTRRISYNTLDEFGLAVRRKLNLVLGSQSIANQRYVSTAIAMPLDTQNAETLETAEDRSREADSDFPQGILSGDVDYASSALDRVGSTSTDTTFTGRLGASTASLLREQRDQYLNVDAEVLDALEPLFLGVWDRDELDNVVGSPLSQIGFLPGAGW